MEFYRRKFHNAYPPHYGLYLCEHLREVAREGRTRAGGRGGEREPLRSSIVSLPLGSHLFPSFPLSAMSSRLDEIFPAMEQAGTN